MHIFLLQCVYACVLPCFIALTFELKREQALQLVYSRRHALKLSTESRTNRLQLEREVSVVIYLEDKYSKIGIENITLQLIITV